MAAMDDPYRTYVKALRTDGAALLAAVAADRDAPVASCPGWDNAELAAHVGRLWHYVSRQIRAGEPIDAGGRPPERVDVLEWASDGLATLVQVLSQTDPAAKSWNWARNEPDTAAFWFRRMAQETAVHRWDAEAAAGAPAPIASWVAADGIDEVLSMWLPRRRGRAKERVSGTVHLHALDPRDPVVDQSSEWFVELEAGGGMSFRRLHQKGDGVLRGTASDILLRLWGRPSAVEELGAAAVLTAMRAE